jgi:3-methyl-2-oxobutanoate hydroxymethyltransferase
MSVTHSLDTATSRANPVPSPMKRLTVPKLKAMKGGEPIVMLTAYTARMAQLLDPHCDLLLVGDSLGQVIYGLPSTVPVTIEMMCAHGAAVVRGSWHALVAVDMPFGSYEASPACAFASAALILKETGAAAVKLEGGERMAETIAFLSERGIPVIGHVGLTPQAVNALGGYGARGRSEAEATKILADARAVAQAGAFLVVLEGVMEEIAAQATRDLECPTIGIGASADCDGQVLVTEDMLGLFERTPRFVRIYDDMAARVDRAASAYAADVRARRFPGEEQVTRSKM